MLNLIWHTQQSVQLPLLLSELNITVVHLASSIILRCQEHVYEP